MAYMIRMIKSLLYVNGPYDEGMLFASKLGLWPVRTIINLASKSVVGLLGLKTYGLEPLDISFAP